MSPSEFMVSDRFVFPVNQHSTMLKVDHHFSPELFVAIDDIVGVLDLLDREGVGLQAVNLNEADFHHPRGGGPLGPGERCRIVHPRTDYIEFLAGDGFELGTGEH